MVKRVLFTPFDLFSAGKFSDAPGEEYIDKNNAWAAQFRELKAAKAQRAPLPGKVAVREGDTAMALHTVYYKPNRLPSDMMSKLGRDDQVYIRGHCIAGFEGIFAHSDRDETGKPMHMVRMNQTLFNMLNDRTKPGRREIRFSLDAPTVVQRLFESGLKPEFGGWIKCYNCHSAEGEPNFATAMRDALAARGYNACGVYGYKGALSSFYDGDHKTSTEGGRASEQRVPIRKPS